jgi:hypothetical protein
MRYHIHMLLMIPPKFSVVHTAGSLKGKSAIQDFREYLQVKRNFKGRNFWARGYCVSTDRIRGIGGLGVHSEPGAGREATGADATGRALAIALSGGFHHTTCSAGSS